MKRKLKKSEILRGAVACLRMGKKAERDKSHFICSSLRIFRQRQPRGVSEAAITAITARIAKRIEGFATAGGWLYENNASLFDDRNEWKDQNFTAIQHWRKAWMLHLADEYEQEGD